MSYTGILIGCGFFARNHMHGWAETDGAEIVAVCDLDRARAEALAEAFGIPRVYTEADEMLRTERPDFADVATTVESHRDLVELCLSHGAATICQKPFAECYADGKAMVQAAARAGRPLIVHENFRWQAPIMALQRRLAEGAVGKPVFARLSFRHSFDIYANQPYLARVQRLALMDVGLHLFDVARFLMGNAVDIHCRTQRLRPGIAGEDAFLATLGHESGAVSSVECSFSAHVEPDPFPQTLAWVEGAEGTLELTFDHRLRLHQHGAVIEKQVEPPVPSWGAPPWHLVQDSVLSFERHVVVVLRGEAEPQPSGAHNLGTLAMALAAYRSAETGETVRLREFEEEMGG